MGVGVQRFNLNQSTNRDKFHQLMDGMAQVNPALLSDYESEFMTGMRDKIADREKFNSDWSPTIAQYQFLRKLHTSLCA